MARFNLLNYADENGEARPGLGIGDEVIDLGEAVAAHERATGTPSGVGRPRGIFLKPGDTVTIELGGIGTLRNPVVQGE